MRITIKRKERWTRSGDRSYRELVAVMMIPTMNHNTHATEVHNHPDSLNPTNHISQKTRHSTHIQEESNLSSWPKESRGFRISFWLIHRWYMSPEASWRPRSKERGQHNGTFCPCQTLASRKRHNLTGSHLCDSSADKPVYCFGTVIYISKYSDGRKHAPWQWSCRVNPANCSLPNPLSCARWASQNTCLRTPKLR